MGLFNVQNSLVTIGDGIQCYRINKDNLHLLEQYYSGIECMYRLPAFAHQGNLIFGGNNYYNVIDGYLYLYHYNQNKLSLVTIPFDKDGHFMRLSETYRYMKAHNIYRIRCVVDTAMRPGEQSIDTLKRYFTVQREHQEYFYDNSRIANMEGSDYREIRHKVNKFMKEYPNVTCRWATKADVHTLDTLYEKWRTEWNGLKYPVIFDRKYYETLVEINPEYFMVFFEGDKPIGFLSYYPSNSTNVHCGFRKLDISYRYLTQYAQVKFCAGLVERGYKYANDDNDNGYRGLRDTKSRFHPIHIMVEYQLIMKGETDNG